ncbi:hypothetical protein [Brevundimonas olei]|uniref:hypothetical protein n=1 Tax=Brevundimonas olei TaxID=657642 RepID=UPI0031E45C40
MAAINIDPADLPEDDRSDFELIPDCDVVAHVISDEVTDKDGGARVRLVLCWEILEGPHAKRRVWDGLNIVNPNDTTERIAKKAVLSLCNIHSIPTPLRDSTLLHFKPTRIKIRTKPADGQWSAQNVIKGYSAATPSGAAAPQQQGVGAPAAGTGNRPWN